MILKVLRLLFVILTVFGVAVFSTKLYEDCFDKHPYFFENHVSGDGGFKLFIRDKDNKMADRFEPGETYKLTISNKMYGTLFWQFSLFSALEMAMDKDMMGITSEQIGDLLISKRYGVINSRCPNSVHSIKQKFFSKIEILWRAPRKPLKCIKFFVQVVKSYSMVFMNEGGLIQKFCPTRMHKISMDKMKTMHISEIAEEMPPMIKECCACGVASYNVTFIGLWSRKTHPREWPESKSMLHWTNPIGVTHTDEYFVYYIGGYASGGVRSVCSYGDNSLLKQQFFSPDVKSQLKSLFTTTGMWNEDDLEKSRSGLISVNRTHHLFSFLTMMGPSPDWCTGIAAADMCLSDCTWKENFSMDLYPFDAGVKYGETYLPKNSDALDLPNPIRIINTTTMKDYPFTPEVPVARVSFQRIKPMNNWECTKMEADGVEEIHSTMSQKMMNENLNTDRNMFKKNRPNSRKETGISDPALAQMATFLCETTHWSAWSPCSVSCGIGTQSRSRIMVKNRKNELCSKLPLLETEDCEGRKRSCDFSAPCSLLSWSEWSPCNATCEKEGHRKRLRMFARMNEKDRCLRKYGTNLKVVEYEPCKRDKNLCDPVIICSEAKLIGTSCGKTETMFYYDGANHTCIQFQYLGCKGSLNRFKTKMECEKTCIPAIESLAPWRRERIVSLQYESKYKSLGIHHKSDMPIAKQCYLSVNYGSMNCTEATKTVRYYYDDRNEKCRQFLYAGCDGNSNNFLTYERCMKACMPSRIHLMDSAPVRDCQISQWSHWGPCSMKCGEGIQYRWRLLEKPAMNGGKPCPALYEERKCFGTDC